MGSGRERDKGEQPPSDLFTSAEARAMLEEFRQMVREGLLHVTPENVVRPSEERAESARERSTEETTPSIFTEEGVRHFNRRMSERLERMREHRLEPEEPRHRITDRQYLQEVRQEVIQRVAERILSSWDAAELESSVRDAVVEQLVKEILRRMERERR